MKKVSHYFSKNLKSTLLTINHIMKPESSGRQDIALVADSLMRLQEERLSADYDTNVPFTREQARISLVAVKDSLAEWARICQEPVGRAYQYYLLNPKIITDHCKSASAR